MADWLIWLLLGGALCVAELFTGTFFLLLLGLAAFTATAAAWFALSGAWQFGLAAVVLVAGLPLVLRASRRQKPASGNYDVGQVIVLADINGQLQGLYSGSYWRVSEVSGAPLKAGDRVRIVRIDGSRLVVSGPDAVPRA